MLVGMMLLSLSACNKENPDEALYRELEKTLLYKYPEAVEIQWSHHNSYILADFKTPSPQIRSDIKHLFSNTAWFDEYLKWQMTESDAPFDALPQAVKNAFKKGQYGGWKIDDIDVLNRENVEFIYVIEVERKDQEIKLYYTEDGLLVKVAVDPEDDGYESFIPDRMSSKIENFIKEKYPDARIIEIEVDDEMTEVEIVDINIERDILFDKDDNWLYTETEMLYKDLPLVIRRAYEASHYSDYEVDDVYHYLMPHKEFYRFEIEKGNDDFEIDIYLDGTIIIVDQK